MENGEEIREVPFAYHPNFISKLADIITQHERQVLQTIRTTKYIIPAFRSPKGLTSHGSTIPQDQLWVKLGGDKGRGSFKFNIQLVNTENLNSVKNTALLSVFKAGDSTTNLHTALDMYKEHIKESQGMKLK